MSLKQHKRRELEHEIARKRESEHIFLREKFPTYDKAQRTLLRSAEMNRQKPTLHRIGVQLYKFVDFS
jgi:hypothetical protein